MKPVTALVPFRSEGRIRSRLSRARRPSMNSLNAVSVLWGATKKSDMGDSNQGSALMRERLNAFSISQTAERDRLFDVDGDTPGCHAGCSAGRNGRSAARD